MKIKIYGTNNCKSCDMLYEVVEEVIRSEEYKNVELEKVVSLLKIAALKIEKIPALEINGNIISEGVVYSKSDMIKILNSYMQETKIDLNNFENQYICDEDGCKLNDKK